MLVSSLREMFRGRRWQQSPVTGESAKEIVKTIAQGMPVDGGGPVVTTLVCFFISHARLWVRTAHPAFPAPSVVEGLRNSLGAIRVARMQRRGSVVDCTRFVVPAKPTGRANARPMTGSARAGTHNHECRCCATLGPSHNHHGQPWLWVPAFAGSTQGVN